MGFKEKKERSLGEHLHLKGKRCSSPKCALIRRPNRPGMHGGKRQRKTLSDFGRQLKEKQKFKVAYGLDERNLLRIFREAAAAKSASTSEKLIELLERRIDNAIFRLGLAESRPMARSLIMQGHITINGHRVRSPGHLVFAGDIIGVRQESKNKAVFRELKKEELKKRVLPPWLNLDTEKLEGKVLSLPKEVEAPFEVNLLVESFSK